MSFSRMLIFISVLILFLSACTGPKKYYLEEIPQPSASQVPVPAPYPLSTQQKMQAVHHWQVLAHDVSCRISDYLSQSVFELHYPVFVATGGNTPFEKAFYDLMITMLVENGVRVTRKKDRAMILSFDLQLVRHKKRMTFTSKGVYRSLAPGMYVKRQNPESISPASIAGSEVHVGNSRINTEAGTYTHQLPKLEIMVTTSLTRNDNYVLRDSSIYYINDADWGNYQQNAVYNDPSVVNYKLVDQ